MYRFIYVLYIVYVPLILFALSIADNSNAGAALPLENQQQQQQQQQQAQPPAPAAQQSYNENLRLVQKTECHSDIEMYCGKIVAQLKPNEVLSDMAALSCLQDAAFHEDTQLQPACGQLVWQYKLDLTQNVQFSSAISKFCNNEMISVPEIKECVKEVRPGYSLSCMMDLMYKIPQNTACFKFLIHTERLAFSDFRLVAPFVEHCSATITALNCGTLTKPRAHQSVRLPHSQGATLQCLMEKFSKKQTDPNIAKIMETFPKDCYVQVVRIAELQADDYHLDRGLFFACRTDRERFCGEVQAGDKNVQNCLLKHKSNKEMQPECAKMLSQHAALMGLDYRLAHPLINACHDEMKSYRCTPQVGFEKSLKFHLSWVLMCLEQNFRLYHKDQQKRKMEKTVNYADSKLLPFSNECQHEMVEHRRLMLSEYRIAPELVMDCAKEISMFCSPNHDIEKEGKTVHCLMAHAQERNNENDKLSTTCRNALEQVIRVADIGSNYRVDNVLYASCKPLIEGKCKMDAVSEANTLKCLMNNFDGPDMTKDCEQRLMEVQYFMARDWQLDPELYNSCHKEAVDRCFAVDNWNTQMGNSVMNVDPGPQVLACLYRAGYDEQNPLSANCAQSVRRVLRDRAARVKLLPDIEEGCRDALSEYCSNNEMKCLQKHFQKKDFKLRYGQCYKQIVEFTKLESKDTRINRLLTRACHPVIVTYCADVAEKEIDHGDVIECLVTHKKVPEMTLKCKSYINHFELITMHDYHFSYHFTEACQQDIQQYCLASNEDKGFIIRCLSNIMFEHRVLGDSKDLKKECKKQLRVAYLQQEQVDFDDKEHLEDADPDLMSKCNADIQRLRCLQNPNNFEDVIECLRVDFDNLDPSCKAVVFAREKIEALDNTFDDELQTGCKYDIGKFCNSQQGDKVLDCLMNTKIVRRLQKGCQKIVQERMLERVRDDRLNPGLLVACKQDAKQYCPEDYRKINDPKYVKQQLGGLIASCLRAKFSQFNSGIRLNPECKDEVSKVILESEFDIQLDPALYKSCRAVINRHCSSAILQHGGNFDNVLECLKADFYTGQITDSDCARQLARRTQESLVDIHLDPGLHEACSVDIQRVCKDTPPGQSRIIMCLMDALQTSQVSISATCRTKLTERQRLWNMAHDQYKMMFPQSWSEMYTAISTHPERISIFTYLTGVLVLLLLIGCICGRWSSKAYSELKNR